MKSGLRGVPRVGDRAKIETVLMYIERAIQVLSHSLVVRKCRSPRQESRGLMVLW